MLVSGRVIYCEPSSKTSMSQELEVRCCDRLFIDRTTGVFDSKWPKGWRTAGLVQGRRSPVEEKNREAFHIYIGIFLFRLQPKWILTILIACWSTFEGLYKISRYSKNMYAECNTQGTPNTESSPLSVPCLSKGGPPPSPPPPFMSRIP